MNSRPKYGTAALVLVSPLLLTAAVMALPTNWAGAMQPVVQNLVYVTLALPLIDPPWAINLNALGRSVTSLACGGAISVLCGVVLRLAHHGITSSMAAGLITGAWVEELLFRVVIPNRLLFVLDPDGNNGRLALAAIVMTQFVFAACHLIFLHRPVAQHDLLTLCRLFIIGMLYTNLITTTGLSFAVGLHAALNAALLTGSHATHSAAALLIIGSVALFLLQRGTCLHGSPYLRRERVRVFFSPQEEVREKTA